MPEQSHKPGFNDAVHVKKQEEKNNWQSCTKHQHKQFCSRLGVFTLRIIAFFYFQNTSNSSGNWFLVFNASIWNSTVNRLFLIVNCTTNKLSNMQELRLELTAVRDLKPSMKNLNMIFIVLEIGNFCNFIFHLLNVFLPWNQFDEIHFVDR